MDISTGYTLAVGTGPGDPEVFAGCLAALGAVALCTGVAAVLPAMAGRTGQLGLAMELCGVAMAAVSATAPIMGPLTDFAMLALGGLMVLGGALLQRRPQAATRV